MAAADKSSRRKLRLNSPDELLADVHQLQRVGYTRAGTWSLGQVCEHLAKTIDGSLDGFTGVKAPRLARLLGPAIGWLTLKFKWIPSGVKMPAGIEPGAATSDGEGVAHLQRSVARMKATDRYHDSPLFGKGSADKWPRHHLIHASHHLSFLIPNV